jgi:hypothetical protein
VGLDLGAGLGDGPGGGLPLGSRLDLRSGGVTLEGLLGVEREENKARLVSLEPLGVQGKALSRPERKKKEI